MALLNEIIEISIDSGITLEDNSIGIEIDNNDFKIKKVEMVSNYKMKLFLENTNNAKGTSVALKIQ